MRAPMRWRRLLIPCKILAAVAVCALVLMAGGWLLRPDLRAPLPAVDAHDLATVTALRDISFPEQPPRLQVEVDYTAGAAAAWWPTGEAPVLAELVAAGKLPPVAERVGPEPLVLAGVDGPGQYGGTWHRIATTGGDAGVMGWRLSGATLVRWSPLGYPIVPHLARAWELSEDGCTYAFHLRRGMRWSDGVPVTTADVAYWWEDQLIDFEGKPKALPQFLQIGAGRDRRCAHLPLRLPAAASVVHRACRQAAHLVPAGALPAPLPSPPRRSGPDRGRAEASSRSERARPLQPAPVLR
jgi:Bacterial extracellular solute-binding proteins, family 5 Middle